MKIILKKLIRIFKKIGYIKINAMKKQKNILRKENIE
jgi:predicted glycosyltransferase